MRRIMVRCTGKDKFRPDLTSFHEEVLGYTDEPEERVVKVLFDMLHNKHTKDIFPAQGKCPEVARVKIPSIKNLLRSTRFCLRIYDTYSAKTNPEEDITLVASSLRHQASNYDHKYGVGLGRFIS